MMKLTGCMFIGLLFFFSGHISAKNIGGVDDWEYKTVSGNLKPTPGCKSKEKASKQATSPYRYKRYTNIMCQNIGYGWSIAKVEQDGEVVCEACEGVEGDGGVEKYRCYVKDVTVKCKIVSRGY